MLNSMMFPGKYYQGKDALEQFAKRTEPLGKSYLLFGTKSALKSAQAKIEKSFEGTDAVYRFELSHGQPKNSEYDRLTALAKEVDPDVVVGIGGGGIIDMARSVAVANKKALVIVPTTVASDAACTNVSIHYSEDGSSVIGADIHPRNPDMIFVDSTIIAQAPVRLLLSGMGDALATYYETSTCFNNAVEQYGELGITYTSLKMSEICRDILFEYGEHAVIACKNNVVTPALERVIEACAFLSGVAGLNSGCAGAHGFADFLSSLPGGHDWLHGERVSIGLVMQLILEGHDTDEIEDLIAFCLTVGMPTSIKDMGYEDLASIAATIGEGAENDFFIGHMSHIDHSKDAIIGACLTAVAISDEMKGL